MMKRILFSFGWLVIVCSVISGLSIAQNFTHDLYAYQTVAGMKTGAVFGLLKTDHQKDAVLIGATSSASSKVEIHTMIQTPDGIWQMREIPSLILEKGQVDLLPTGYHLMLIDLKSPLNPGETLSLELHYQNGDKQVLSIPIIKRGEKPMISTNK